MRTDLCTGECATHLAQKRKKAKCSKMFLTDASGESVTRCSCNFSLSLKLFKRKRWGGTDEEDKVAPQNRKRPGQPNRPSQILEKKNAVTETDMGAQSTSPAAGETLCSPGSRLPLLQPELASSWLGRTHAHTRADTHHWWPRQTRRVNHLFFASV